MRRSDSHSAVWTIWCFPASGLLGRVVLLLPVAVAVEQVVVHVEDARRLPDALEQDAEPEDVHGRVVQHRAAHEPERQLRLPADLPVDLVAVEGVRALRLLAHEPEVQLVGRLPDVERQHLADRACALARAPDRAADRDGVLRRPRHVALDGVALAGGLVAEALAEVGVLARDGDDGPPHGLRRHLGVEGERARDLQQARRALGAVEVAAHPEAVIGDAGDHEFTVTQVSFEPPPWLEFTT